MIRIGSAARSSSFVNQFLLDSVVQTENSLELKSALDEVKAAKQQLEKAKRKMQKDGEKKEFIQCKQNLR